MIKKMLPCVVAIAILLVSGCKEDDLLYDMARFDRTYIPALILSSGRDTSGQSIFAVKRLRQDWMLLEAKYSHMFTDGGEASSIGDIISRSDMMISTGEYQKAHTELEKIRGILLEARKKYGVDYYLDHLTEFHSTMERIVGVVRGKPVEEISASDINKMQGMLSMARVQWKGVEAAPFERSSFRFTEDDEKALMLAVAAQAKNIEVFDAALRSRNKKLIAMNAMKLKGGFLSVFRMFGDFESISL